MSSARAGGRERRGARVRADDINRLNGALAANVRFRIVRPVPGSKTSGVRRAGGAAGVLVARLADGGERRAASPLAAASSRRARLLLLSGCLAECAMSLGLGTAVYRRPSAPGEEAGGGAP